MQPRRLNEIFASLFDPRVPLLFLLGSLVLAVLSNGIYDLIVELLGPLPGRLWYVVSGALLALALLVLTLLRVVREHVAPVQIAPDQRADPQAGLVLLVSENPQAAAEAAVAFHMAGGKLRHCVLLVTHSSVENANRIEAMLRGGNDAVEVSRVTLSDAFAVQPAYRAVEQALQLLEAQLGQVSVDITGGTKLMTAGAVLACRDYGVPMEYVRVPFREGLPQTSVDAQVMKVRLE